MSAKSRCRRPTLKKRKNPTAPFKPHHPRMTPEGMALGEQIVALTEPGIRRLAREGEPDQRCASCAFRAGTVPNGCPQTGMDAIKAVMEGVVFTCHMSPGMQTPCHGWYAARTEVVRRVKTGIEPIVCDWDFSPPDVREENAHA